MRTHRSRQSGSAKWTLIIALALAACVAAAYKYQPERSGEGSATAKATIAGTTTRAGEPNQEERKNAYLSAVEKAKTSTNWPSTPEELIREFWQAGSQKQYDRMIVLCPGAVENDFRSHYDKMPPSPVKSIGAQEAHPTAPAVAMYPVIVPFPYFPNKTVKMAIAKTAEGRLVVDGQHTIWW